MTAIFEAAITLLARRVARCADGDAWRGDDVEVRHAVKLARMVIIEASKTDGVRDPIRDRADLLEQLIGHGERR